MFEKFFSSSSENKKDEDVVLSEGYTGEAPGIDENWSSYLLDENEMVVSAHEANESKNKLATIANLFPEQFKH